MSTGVRGSFVFIFSLECRFGIHCLDPRSHLVWPSAVLPCHFCIGWVFWTLSKGVWFGPGSVTGKLYIYLRLSRYNGAFFTLIEPDVFCVEIAVHLLFTLLTNIFDQRRLMHNPMACPSDNPGKQHLQPCWKLSWICLPLAWRLSSMVLEYGRGCDLTCHRTLC